MLERRKLLIGLVVLVLALAFTPAVTAGKGSAKGKPSGGGDHGGGTGGGGDVTALHELVFIAQVALEGNTGRAYNAGDLVSCNVNGTDLVRISSDSTEVGFALVAGWNVSFTGAALRPAAN